MARAEPRSATRAARAYGLSQTLRPVPQNQSLDHAASGPPLATVPDRLLGTCRPPPPVATAKVPSYVAPPQPSPMRPSWVAAPPPPPPPSACDRLLGTVGATRMTVATTPVLSAKAPSYVAPPPNMQQRPSWVSAVQEAKASYVAPPVTTKHQNASYVSPVPSSNLTAMPMPSMNMVPPTSIIGGVVRFMSPAYPQALGQPTSPGPAVAPKRSWIPKAIVGSPLPQAAPPHGAPQAVIGTLSHISRDQVPAVPCTAVRGKSLEPCMAPRIASLEPPVVPRRPRAASPEPENRGRSIETSEGWQPRASHIARSPQRTIPRGPQSPLPRPGHA